MKILLIAVSHFVVQLASLIPSRILLKPDAKLKKTARNCVGAIKNSIGVVIDSG